MELQIEQQEEEEEEQQEEEEEEEDAPKECQRHLVPLTMMMMNSILR